MDFHCRGCMGKTMRLERPPRNAMPRMRACARARARTHTHTHKNAMRLINKLKITQPPGSSQGAFQMSTNAFIAISSVGYRQTKKPNCTIPSKQRTGVDKTERFQSVQQSVQHRKAELVQTIIRG